MSTPASEGYEAAKMPMEEVDKLVDAMDVADMDRDYDLCIRLARLCGIEVENHANRSMEHRYPYVIISSVGRLIFIESVDEFSNYESTWNPLEDERQAWRYVVKAVVDRGWKVGVYCHGETLTQVVVQRDPKSMVSMMDERDIPRLICLAALEAWEKLEKNDEN